MYGKSVSNQRIEAWWGQLRKNSTDWWINHFKSLRDGGLYSDGDVLHVECLKFCYMPVIRVELQRVAIHWNVHRIRPSSNPDSPAGRLDSLFFLPSLVSQQTRDCKHAFDNSDRGGSRISKGGVDGRPYLLRGGRENALTKKIGNNFTCTCLRRVF